MVQHRVTAEITRKQYWICCADELAISLGKKVTLYNDKKSGARDALFVVLPLPDHDVRRQFVEAGIHVLALEREDVASLLAFSHEFGDELLSYVRLGCSEAFPHPLQQHRPQRTFTSPIDGGFYHKKACTKNVQLFY